MWGDHFQPLEPARFTGPLNVVIHGDVTRGAALIPVARTLLGGLRQRLAQGGIDSGTFRCVLGGAIITVACGIGVDLARINVPTGAEEPVQISAHGFILYPKTDTAPYGLHHLPVAAVYPVDDAPPLPPPAWIKLSRVFNATTHSVALRPSGLTVALAGNQFIFVDQAVYSWWHSPLGDGPMASLGDTPLPTDEPRETGPYRPYYYLAAFTYKDVQGLPHRPPQVIYRNGLAWQSLWGRIPSEAVICGMMVARVSVLRDGVPTVSERCLVAYTEYYGDLHTTLVAFTVRGDRLDPLPVLNPLDYSTLTHPEAWMLLYPVRFAPNGLELCFLDGSTDADQPDTPYLSWFRAPLTHQAETVTMGALVREKYYPGTITSTIYEDHPTTVTGDPAGTGYDHSVTTGNPKTREREWTIDYRTELADRVGSESTYQGERYPIGLSYTPEGGLKVAWAQVTGSVAANRVDASNVTHAQSTETLSSITTWHAVDGPRGYTEYNSRSNRDGKNTHQETRTRSSQTNQQLHLTIGDYAETITLVSASEQETSAYSEETTTHQDAVSHYTFGYYGPGNTGRREIEPYTFNQTSEYVASLNRTHTQRTGAYRPLLYFISAANDCVFYALQENFHTVTLTETGHKTAFSAVHNEARDAGCEAGYEQVATTLDEARYALKGVIAGQTVLALQRQTKANQATVSSHEDPRFQCD